eukprot:363132-Chlamydomonas_euryale.AAC.23
MSTCQSLALIALAKHAKRWVVRIQPRSTQGTAPFAVPSLAVFDKLKCLDAAKAAQQLLALFLREIVW